MMLEKLMAAPDALHACLSVAGRDLSVRRLQHEGEGGVDFLDLHHAVFSTDVNRSWLDWKYGKEVTQGHGLGSGLWDGDALIAHCGGVPRTLIWEDKSISGLQIGDVMVRADWRGVMVRKGPFYHVSSHFYRNAVGGNATYAVGYGFPNARHLKLAVSTGLLLDGGSVQAPCWDVRTHGLSKHWHCVWRMREQTDVVRKSVEVTESAWHAMREDIARLSVVCGARTANYLLWRYLVPPHADRYHFFALEKHWGRVPLGWVVLDLSNPGIAVWLDWIGPLKYMPAAWQGVMNVAKKLGKWELNLWATLPVMDAISAPKPRAVTETARLGIVNGSLHDVRKTDGCNWWLMGGDTDFL